MSTRTLTLRGLTTSVLLTCCLQACSGRAVDLDRASGAASAGASGDDTVLLELDPSAPMCSEILIDNTRLYWIDWNGDLDSCLKDNCAPSVTRYANVLAKGIAGLLPHIAVGGGYVYWFSNDNTLYSCPTTGCGKAPTRMIQDSSFPIFVRDALAADAGYVYWTSALDLYRCAATGCGSAPEIVEPARASDPTFSPENAYWIDIDPTGNTLTWDSAKNMLRTAPRDGSAPPTTMTMDVQNVAANTATVYWINSSNNVLSCPAAGCSDPPAVLDATETSKDHLAVDDSGLFWREEPDNPGAVHFCPLGECSSAATLTPSGVMSFAVDAQYLYWVETEAGTASSAIALHRVAKP